MDTNGAVPHSHAEPAAAVPVDLVWVGETFEQGLRALETKQFELAISCFDAVLAQLPHHAPSWINRGNAVQYLFRLGEAVANYDRAMQLDPSSAVPHRNQAAAYLKACRLPEAQMALDAALRCDPNDVVTHWSRALASFPIMRPHATPTVAQVARDFSNAMDRLAPVLDAVPAEQAAGLVQWPFELAYLTRNNRAEMAQFGHLCAKLMQRWQVHHGVFAAHRPRQQGKLRIGIASGMLRRHSVWDAITQGVVQHLDRSCFEVVLFHLDVESDDQTQWARSQADAFVEGGADLVDWAQKILAAQLDVLIYPEVGMHHLTFNLACMRLAPVQCVSWGHPETSGLPTMDHYLSAALLEPEGGVQVQQDPQYHYTERLVRLPNLGCTYAPPTQTLPSPMSDADLAALGLRADQPILISPGMVYKYAPETDALWADLMARCATSQLVLFEKLPYTMPLLLARWADAFAAKGLSVHDCVRVVPWMDALRFFALMQRATVFVDSVGFSGFNTALQAVECGVPIVTMDGDFMRGRLASGILKRLGLAQDGVAKDEADYLAKVHHLLTDPDHHARFRQQLIAQRHLLFNDLAPIRALEDFLLSRCRPQGPTPATACASAG